MTNWEKLFATYILGKGESSLYIKNLHKSGGKWAKEKNAHQETEIMKKYSLFFERNLN